MRLEQRSAWATGRRVIGVMVASSLLAGCNSARFGGPILDPPPQRRAAIADLAPVEAVPAPQVDTAPIPAPPGAASAPLEPGGPPGGLVAPGQSFPGAAPSNLNPPNAPPAQPRAPSVASAAPVAPSRTSVTGNWTLGEAAGNRCKVTLSSVSKLDLYGASTNGCQARELQKVNAWELRGDEVVLYETGGTVAARLRPAPGGAFAGASTQTGAPITLSK